jgi:hypothetical protein
MLITSPLKMFLKDTIADWDQRGTPLNVRENLWKIVNCGTAALGAEVFASSTTQKIVYHTCKSVNRDSAPPAGLELKAYGKPG